MIQFDQHIFEMGGSTTIELSSNHLFSVEGFMGFRLDCQDWLLSVYIYIYNV